MRKDLETTLVRYGYALTDEELRVLKNVQRQTAGMSDEELTRALAVGLRRRTSNPPSRPAAPGPRGVVLLDQTHQGVPRTGAEARRSFGLACRRLACKSMSARVS